MNESHNLPADSDLLVPLNFQEFSLYQSLLNSHKKLHQEEPDTSTASSPEHSDILSHPEDGVAPREPVTPEPLSESETASPSIPSSPAGPPSPSLSSAPTADDDNPSTAIIHDSSSRSGSSVSTHEEIPQVQKDFQTSRYSKKGLPSWTSEVAKGKKTKIKAQKSAQLIEKANEANEKRQNKDFTELRTENLPNWSSQKDTKFNDKDATITTALDNVINDVKKGMNNKSCLKSLLLFQKKVRNNKVLSKKLMRLDPDNLRSLLLKGFSKNHTDPSPIKNEKAFLKGLDKAGYLFLLPNVAMTRIVKSAPWYKIFQ